MWTRERPAPNFSASEAAKDTARKARSLPSVVATESPEAELRRLRQENRELQMRCEILKKTVGIFSGPLSSDMGRSSK